MKGRILLLAVVLMVVSPAFLVLASDDSQAELAQSDDITVSPSIADMEVNAGSSVSVYLDIHNLLPSYAEDPNTLVVYVMMEQNRYITASYPEGQRVVVDVGLVGEVIDTNVETIEDLLAQGITPVVYPIGKDGNGVMLNVNADTMAAGIASGIKCTEMVAITDVPGILTDINDPNLKIDKLDLKRVDELIADGTISGGMIPKVEACRNALLAGVGTVRMVNGKDKRSIVTDIMKDVPHGTIIVK